MTSHASNRDRQSNTHANTRAPAQAIPPFKPVALPALAAAVRSAKRQPPEDKKNVELPAILRKEAMLDR